MTFATQLSATFTPIAAVYDDPSITQALGWAQSFVENYCNRTFDETTETVYLDPKRYHQALLPQVPVVTVSTVQGLLPSNGSMTWTSLTNYAFVADTGLIYDTTGEPGVTWNTGPSWPWLPGSLQVNYTFGYSPIPNDLVNCGCRFAQQYLENPSLQLSRRVGDVQDVYFGGYSSGADPASVGVILNLLDKMILDRYTQISIA